jgi:ribonucleoside-diphosphate reductase beta chain
LLLVLEDFFFAYVYFLRSKRLLHGLASGTNWVFRDESCHISFAFEIIRTSKEGEAVLFNEELKLNVMKVIDGAIKCEMVFANDLLNLVVVGLSNQNMKQCLEFVANVSDFYTSSLNLSTTQTTHTISWSYKT